MQVEAGRPTGHQERRFDAPVHIGNDRTRGMVNFEAAVMDRLNAAVIVTDLAGTLLYANPFAEHLYGRPVEELIGSGAGELAGVELDAGTAAEIRAELVAGRSWEGDFTVHRPDGVSLTVHASDSGLFGDGGDLIGVVSIVTDITDHRESVERMTRETGGLRFLLEATTVLASSLDFRECLRRLARLAVPILGDLCLIDVMIDGTISRMAAAHADPRRHSLAQELAEKYPPHPRGSHPAARTMSTGRPEISPDISDDFLRATTRDERHYAIVKELEFTSYMCAPLTARGRILGTLTLVSSGSGRRFDIDDLALAEDLAHRAALVIDNARLFSERARVARSLQAALLPPRLPEIPGLELAARYRAAGEGNEVGGDFYDVFSIGRNAWAAAVGDVCGKGPEAAAVTGLVRHSLHASAQQSRDPAEMLQTANAVLHEQQPSDPERFCSASCAIIRPGPPVRIAFASAGHPPAVVLRADGRVEEVEGSGLALGIASSPGLQSRRSVLGPGDLVLMYTDGLTEARDAAGGFFGEGPFRSTLVHCRGLGAEETVARVLDAVESFSGGQLNDDLAVLAVRASES